MISVLVDHNMEGQAILLWGALAADGWLDLVPLRLMTFREKRTSTSLPVITIGSRERLDEHAYRERCATRLVEIAVDLDAYAGVTRLFIP